MSVVFDVSFGWNRKGLFVVLHLLIKAVDGVVKCGDGGLMGLFPRTDGGSEETDDVDEESGAILV
jgi:hypothetical protein